MELTISTPALLFPTVSLLMLAFTNRFLAIASLVRSLHSRYKERPDLLIKIQINTLRQRLLLIRNMQVFGSLSLFCCVLSMFLIFANQMLWGKYVFGIGLFFMLISLGLSLWEIFVSVNALDIQLKDMENDSLIGEHQRGFIKGWFSKI